MTTNKINLYSLEGLENLPLDVETIDVDNIYQCGKADGHNKCVDQLKPLAIELDKNAIEILAVEAMNQEQIRNGINLPTHKFSMVCSCGRCHTASIIADILCANPEKIVKLVRGEG